MSEKESKAPTAKVQAAGAAGAAATLVVFIAAQFGLEIPTGVEGAIATLLAFAAGWLKS